MSYSLSSLSASNIPALFEEGQGIEEWNQNRERILRVWQEWLGPMPERVPIEYKITSEVTESDHIRLHLSYKVAYGDEVTAVLLIPGQSKEPSETFPAIMALHPTTAAGKLDITLEEGRQNRTFGYELVKRGYVVFAPDTITAGERVYEGTDAYQTAPFYEKHPEWTAIGKMLHDHQQGLDVLCSFPFVQQNHIGAIGHSLGGYNAFFLGGVDSRIQAIVSSCGFSTFAGDADPNRWGQRDWFSHMPKLSNAIEKDEVPFEFHEIVALCAPTPFLNWSGQVDHIFPHWKAIGEAMNHVGALYELLDAKDAFISLLGYSGHDFPPQIRELAYRFFDDHLR